MEALVVELEAGGDLDLDAAGVVHVRARLEHLLDGDLCATTSWMWATKRSFSLGLSSMVRKVSVNWKASTTTPSSLEKAPALTMFMPQAAERAGDVGEEAGAVADDNGELEELAVEGGVRAGRGLYRD